jgi:hypothetical protein
MDTTLTSDVLRLDLRVNLNKIIRPPPVVHLKTAIHARQCGMHLRIDLNVQP